MTVPPDHDPDPETEIPDSDVPDEVPDEVPERQNPDYRAPGDGVEETPMRMPGEHPDVETEI